MLFQTPLSPDFIGAPSHVGMVWIHPEFGPCVLEVTPFNGETEHMRREESEAVVWRRGHARLTPLDYYRTPRKNCGCRSIIRRLQNANVRSENIESAVQKLMSDTPYPRDFLSVGAFSKMFGRLVIGERLAELIGAPFDFGDPGMICTEFVAEVYDCLGLLASKQNGVRMAPLEMGAALGRFDRMLAKGISLGPEQRLIPRPHETR